MTSSLTRVSDFLAAWRNEDAPTVIAKVDGIPLYASDLHSLAEDLVRDRCDLWDLDLPQRPYNALRRNHIRTIDQLTGRTRAQLLEVTGLGAGSVDDIEAALERHGRTLTKAGA